MSDQDQFVLRVAFVVALLAFTISVATFVALVVINPDGRLNRIEQQLRESGGR